MTGSPPPDGSSDVRMRGFARRWTVEAALAWTDSVEIASATECVSLDQLAGRVLTSNITSDVDVPGYPRAMMDGYAVQAQDTAGATSYHPLPLKLVGQVLPGSDFSGQIAGGEAVRIMTGSPIPPGADAVLPVEKTQAEGDQILALEALPKLKHIGPQGEDIRAGDVVLHRGRRLRPQDVGLLSSIGCASAEVVARPRVRIVVTGNELLPSGTRPQGSKIADSNGPMLAALVTRDGGETTDRQIVADRPDSILQAMQDDVDVVLISGGSSVGIEDFAPQLLATHGQLDIHGVAMRPSSPSGMGTIDGHPVFLLPGNPVSCLCSYDFFARRVIQRISGRPIRWPYRDVQLPLSRKLVSQIGRVDYARVKIDDGRATPMAVGGASLLSSTTRADGFVIVSADCEGYPPDTLVKVYLYDEPA